MIITGATCDRKKMMLQRTSVARVLPKASEAPQLVLDRSLLAGVFMEFTKF
jgi:hypothetical protein